jgi:hypothetical protein
MSIKTDDNCIPINNIKGVRFGIRDTCKNWEKENLGKDRYKRECVESYGGLNMKIPPKILKIEEEIEK